MQGSRQVVNLGAQSGGVGLLTDVVQHQVNVLACWHLSVTHGIQSEPQTTPRATEESMSPGCLIAVSMERSSGES